MNELDVTELIIKETDARGIHIECSDLVSDKILSLMEQEKKSLGIIYRSDQLYERMKVQQYLGFFAKIHENPDGMDKAVAQMHLEKYLSKRIKRLTYGEKRRVSLAREMIHNPDYLFIQEPLLNLDEDSMQYILKWIERSAEETPQIFTSSVSLKLLYLMEGSYFYADDKEVRKLRHIDQELPEADAGEETQETEVERVRKLPVIEKISARTEDKVLLFNPGDIDYFESMNGKVYVHVRREYFPTIFTMDELENQLHKYGFFRCHRSYLVNMQKVTEVIRWTRNSYSLKIEGSQDADIPLSKGRIEELKEIYRF